MAHGVSSCELEARSGGHRKSSRMALEGWGKVNSSMALTSCTDLQDAPAVKIISKATLCGLLLFFTNSETSVLDV